MIKSNAVPLEVHTKSDIIHINVFLPSLVSINYLDKGVIHKQNLEFTPRNTLFIVQMAKRGK